VAFHSTAKAVHDFYQQEKMKSDTDTDLEKTRLVETAAKLIRNYIKGIETILTHPIRLVMASEDACINILRETLRVLLQQLMVGKPYILSI